MQLGDFPTLDSTLEGRTRDKVIEAFKLLTVGLEGGEIPNVRYNDTVKYYLNDAAGTIWNAVVRQRVVWDRDLRSYTFDGVAFSDADKAVYDLVGWGVDAHLIPGKLAKVEKLAAKTGMTPYASEVLAALKEAAPIAIAIKGVKDQGRVVKRQPKLPEDLRAKYNAPEASQRAIGRVRDILIEITQEAYDALLSRLVERNGHKVDAYIAITKELNEANPSGKRPANRDDRARLDKLSSKREELFYGVRELSDAVEKVDPASDNHSGYCYALMRRSAKADEVIATVAKKDAAAIRDAFIYKNLVKLDSVLEAKGDFVSIEKISYAIDLSGLEAELRLHFKDGAHFEVRNSVKWVVNRYETEFMQYPLTFHNVFMSGGRRMKGPSEEKMNTEFVGRPAA